MTISFLTEKQNMLLTILFEEMCGTVKNKLVINSPALIKAPNIQYQSKLNADYFKRHVNIEMPCEPLNYYF